MHRPTLCWIALLALAVPSLASAKVDKDTPFAAALVAPSLEVAAGDTGELVVRFEVHEQHFLYRDMSAVSGAQADGVTLAEGVFPPGKKKYDSVSEQTREIFEHGFEVKVPVSVSPDAAPGPRTVTLPVRYQGCNLPENYCLFPVKTELTATVNVAAKKASLLDLLVGTAHAGGASSRPKEPAVDFSALPGSADVQETGADDEAHPVRARLLVDKTALTPGGAVRLAVHLTPRKNWHTYWKSPGDIGLPTKIRWALPEGAAATPFQFPVPERFDQEGIVSYGYDGPVLFFTEVTLPDSLATGDVTVGAHAEWLVCEIMCIRGEADLSLTLPVGPSEDTPFAALMDHYAAQHPTHATDVRGFALETAFSASAVRPEESFKLALRLTPTGDRPIKLEQSAGTWPGFTPIVSLNGMINETTVSKLDSGAVQILLDAETFEADELPTSDVLGGLFTVHVGDEIVRTEVSIPVPWAKAGAPVLTSTSPLFGAASTATGGGEPAAGEAVAEPDVAPKAPAGAAAFLMALLSAFLGGLILNIMPCVLPVLTMKLYSLVEQVDMSPAHRRTSGYAYTAGILVSFLGLAAAVVVMKVVLGKSVLWGFQFQNTTYVAVLTAIVFTFGLSLFGVFEVPALGANSAAQASAKDGVVGYFLTGVFATLLATPCSAPFLTPAMGFAFSLPGAQIVVFFLAVGLGLAFPFLLIAVVPGLYRFLPRPGAWMESFKHVMGFLLMATTLWLVDVLAGALGRDGATGYLAFLFFIALGAWILGRFGGPAEEPKRQIFVLALAVAVVAAGGHFWLDLERADPVLTALTDDCEGDFSEEIPWQPFSEAQVEKFRGKPIFIDFTADWCLTCKANEKGILSKNPVRSTMGDLGVCPLKADWSHEDPVISAWLKRHGRAGVPFYLLLPADPDAPPIALPDIITPGLVVDAMKQAAGQS